MKHFKWIGFSAAILAAFLLPERARAQGVPICKTAVFKHITTATDTQIAAAVGGLNVYICDIEISWNGTGNIFLEKSSSGTCAAPTQIGQAYYGVANTQKAHSNPFWNGQQAGVGNQLCVNSSAAVTIDVTVYFDQTVP
jgi:hypothetical protein